MSAYLAYWRQYTFCATFYGRTGMRTPASCGIVSLRAGHPFYSKSYASLCPSFFFCAVFLWRLREECLSNVGARSVYVTYGLAVLRLSTWRSQLTVSDCLVSVSLTDAVRGESSGECPRATCEQGKTTECVCLCVSS